MSITTIKVPSEWADRKDCEGTAFVGTVWKNQSATAVEGPDGWKLDESAPLVAFDEIQFVVE